MRFWMWREGDYFASLPNPHPTLDSATHDFDFECGVEPCLNGHIVSHLGTLLSKEFTLDTTRVAISWLATCTSLAEIDSRLTAKYFRLSVSMGLRPTRHILGYFWADSFSAINCDGTDSLKC